MVVVAHAVTAAAITAAIAGKDWTRRSKYTAVLISIPLSHYALDLVPHAEPSLTGTSYLAWFTPAFSLAAADNLLMAWFWWEHVRPRYLWISRRMLGLAALLAWLPDFLTYLVGKGYLSADLWRLLSRLHTSSHVWWWNWYNAQPLMVSIPLGILTTAVAGISAYRYLIWADHQHHSLSWNKVRLNRAANLARTSTES